MSTFQLIPREIVRMILGYVASIDQSTSYTMSEYYYLEYQSQDLLQLLWVSRNFRDVVYHYLCSFYSIDLEAGHNKPIPSWPLWPRCLQKLDCPLSHMSKRLNIMAGLQRVYSGDSLTSLARALPDVQSLPLIRSVYLELNDTFHTPAFKGQSSEAKANIRAFAQQLKQLVPNIVDIDVR
ncbi:hypothetical protein GGI21_003188, partial [Coemansia aciculifera]